MGWTVASNPTYVSIADPAASSTTFTTTANAVDGGTAAITANFTDSIDTFTLTYTAGANGTISGTSPQTVAYGASGTAVTAIPMPGYHFLGWSDGITTATRTDANVTGNLTVTANFTTSIDVFTLTYIAGANGTIAGVTSQAVAYGGTGTAVTAVPTPGYHFVNWTGTIGFVTTTANPLTVTNVTSSQTITANFTTSIDTFALTYIAGPNGTIAGTASQTVALGASGTAVVAVPTPGYRFVIWSDGSTANPRIDTNVTANLAVTARFVPDVVDTFTLTYAAGMYGTISGAASQTVAASGSGTAVTAVPTSGYRFLNWSDGSTVNPRTDINVMANVTVTASFTPRTVPSPSSLLVVLTVESNIARINGMPVTMDAAPVIRNSRTILPIRALMETLGGSTSWNAAARTATVKLAGRTVVLTIGKNTALVNGVSVTIDPSNPKVIPEIISGRTYLPLRFIAENLGLDLAWDAPSQTISFTYWP